MGLVFESTTPAIDLKEAVSEAALKAMFLKMFLNFIKAKLHLKKANVNYRK